MCFQNFIYIQTHFHNSIHSKCMYIINHVLNYFINHTMMREGYLLKSNHVRQTHHLPQLKFKKIKSYLPSSIQQLNVPDEKALLQEIKDIDTTLNSHEFSYYSGNLFSSIVSEKLVNQLHAALTRPAMILQTGYNFLDGGHPSDQKVKQTNRIETFNQKMANLSVQNVYDYDLNKYHLLMKNNRNRWSLFKRQQRVVTQESEQTTIQNKNYRKRTNNTGKNSSNVSVIDQKKYETVTQKNYPSSRKRSQLSTKQKNTPLSHSKLDVDEDSNTLTSLLNPNRFADKSSKKSKNIYRKKHLTEISEVESPQDDNQHFKISKFQIKNMLKREGNKLVVIWLPPASYPHFNGLFTYSIGKSLTSCKLKKYFLFRRSLNDRLFNAILEHISHLENCYIESLQLLTCKQDFIKIFEPVGWVMKSMQGMDKLRIKFNRKKA